MAEGPSLCRDCGARPEAATCPDCGGRRIVRHPELFTLHIAHVDCDAFYASVEKRDRPELAGSPVIVGGGVRGVVTAACYIARIYGIRSAMPMWKALKACPDATVIRPDFSKYVAAARQIRALMADLTPLMQPLSIDEAVLDLRGTEALHEAPPAAVLARFARRVETEDTSERDVHEVEVAVTVEGWTFEEAVDLLTEAVGFGPIRTGLLAELVRQAEMGGSAQALRRVEPEHDDFLFLVA